MNDSGRSHSPQPGRPFDTTDEQLSAELRKWTGATPALHPVGALLDRHWEAAFAYARLCTDGPRPAGMLTTAAFTRLFGESLRQSGPTAAWRPQLLVTVRRIAAEWGTDHRREMLHPDLRSAAGDRVAAHLLPPADRRLLSRAFQRLPQSARAVLWHSEVEAEPLSVPAGLLGLEEEDARVELRRAQERLRDECLQVHRELAPEQECLRYLRLLDVTYRRGGVDIDPDLREHLARCSHCRYTADQLSQFNADLGTVLAEGVLGWGAQAYREVRLGGFQDFGAGEETPPPPSAFAADSFGGAEAFAAAPAGGPVGGESFTSPAPAGPPFGESLASAMPADPAGRESASTEPGSRTASRRSAHRAHRAHRARRATRRRNLAAAVATVSGLVVLPLVLWSVLGSGDGTVPTGEGQSGAAGSGTSSTDPTPVGAGTGTKGTLHGRLHNAGSGLCVAVVGKKAVKGAETELAKCSSTPSQQWIYEADGLLRNGADTDLCLDSHLGYSVRLEDCTPEPQPGGKDVRYDFNLQGTLVPRFAQDLALSPAATDGGGALVLKARTDSKTQRWTVDSSKADLQMEMVNWDADVIPSQQPSADPSPSPSTPKK